jgi:hypothetical protein
LRAGRYLRISVGFVLPGIQQLACRFASCLLAHVDCFRMADDPPGATAKHYGVCAAMLLAVADAFPCTNSLLLVIAGPLCLMYIEERGLLILRRQLDSLYLDACRSKKAQITAGPFGSLGDGPKPLGCRRYGWGMPCPPP